MISVFGWRSANVHSSQTPSTTCTRCSATTPFQLDVYREYMHAFWIPFFPMGKMALLQCPRCGASHRTPDIPEEYTPLVTSALAAAARPLWMFAGIPILLAGIAWAYLQQDKASANLSSESRATRLSSCLAHPVAGQLYELKLGPASYNPSLEVKTLIRITGVDADSVTFEKSLMQKPLGESMFEGQMPQAFDHKSITLSKTEFTSAPLLDCR